MAVASPCDELIPLILFSGAYDSKGSLEDQWQIPFSLELSFLPCWTPGFFIFVGFVVSFSPFLPFRKSF